MHLSKYSLWEFTFPSAQYSSNTWSLLSSLIVLHCRLGYCFSSWLHNTNSKCLAGIVLPEAEVYSLPVFLSYFLTFLFQVSGDRIRFLPFLFFWEKTSSFAPIIRSLPWIFNGSWFSSVKNMLSDNIWKDSLWLDWLSKAMWHNDAL